MAPATEAPRVVTALSSILERLSVHNDAATAGCGLPSASAAGGTSVPLYERAASAFHGLKKPSISVRGYLERIFQYANCSESCYVVAYVYLDRFVRRHGPVLAVDSFNVHRLLITSVLSAVKFMEDKAMHQSFQCTTLHQKETKTIQLNRIPPECTLQQWLLCQGRRDQPDGDELLGSRLPVRSRI